MTANILPQHPATEPLEARPMANVFTSRLASQPKPVLLADRLRWHAANLRRHGSADVAVDLERAADALAQAGQSAFDMGGLVAERDATIARLNETIRRCGGGQQ